MNKFKISQVEAEAIFWFQIHIISSALVKYKIAWNSDINFRFFHEK